MAFFSKQQYFGKHTEILEVPNLVELQLNAYEEFLQSKIPSISREIKGLEAIIREIFPIDSYDGRYSLEYLGYELGKPRYTPDECRKLKLTYGAPFKIRVKLINKNEKVDPKEEEVYLGEIPIMIGGGEFIINGAERVIVSQLHRSPGVDFAINSTVGDKPLHSCWIIPERGSWIDINVTKKDTLLILIDKNIKFPITTFVRAMDEKFSSDEQILSLFYNSEKVSLKSSTANKKLVGCITAKPLLLKEYAEEERLFPAGTKITEALAQTIVKNNDEILILRPKIYVKKTEENDKKKSVEDKFDMLILNTLEEDTTSDRKRDLSKEPDGHRAALAKIFAKLRPGNPFNFEKAKNLFCDRFNDPTRYRLGRVGRFRLNRKFKQNVSSDEMDLKPEDIVNSIRYIMGLRQGIGEIDDIDHLGNRRIRTIVELAGDEFRKGFLKLKRTIQERMSSDADDNFSPKSLINAKTISSSIEYFFGRGELSQVVDQTNPLAQLTHERRLSALGPGGLNRKRAGFEVRDVTMSHYGRICPI